MSSHRPMRAVGLGWDIGRPGGDKTVYYCQQHGHLTEPCSCIDAYFKSQVRAARSRQIDESEDGISELRRRMHAAAQRR